MPSHRLPRPRHSSPSQSTHLLHSSLSSISLLLLHIFIKICLPSRPPPSLNRNSPTTSCLCCILGLCNSTARLLSSSSSQQSSTKCTRSSTTSRPHILVTTPFFLSPSSPVSQPQTVSSRSEPDPVPLSSFIILLSHLCLIHPV